MTDLKDDVCELTWTWDDMDRSWTVERPWKVYQEYDGRHSLNLGGLTDEPRKFETLQEAERFALAKTAP
jgi:hypothetical protein